jgi:hypothetical protein
MSGGLTMKKILFAVLLLSLSLYLFGCKTGDDALFSDSFDYALASPWDLTSPVNGWSKTVGPADNWNIVGSGNPANALQYLGSGVSQLTNDYSGSDYQISVQFMPVNLFTDNPFCLAGRIDGSHNCYVVCVNDNGSNIYLNIEKYSSGSLTSFESTLVTGTYPLDLSTWYTLTMTLQGNMITGNITGGGLTDTTVTYTDPGSIYASGEVGILVWNVINSTYQVLFDNYEVTTIPSE